ncbi:hypothetical protein H0H87_012652 [Tephrocybe sp. NHM501043]|nr:hypothetical protein H0H87_012652 [Tephrocybe sp. NHM501043]
MYTAGSSNSPLHEEALRSLELGHEYAESTSDRVPATTTTSSTSVKPSLMNIPPSEDPLLHYVTSWLTLHGHRARASRIVSNTLLHIHAFTRAPPMPIFRQAIISAAPAVRTLSHRHGGKAVLKPIALGEKQRIRYSVKEILEASKAKVGRTVEERLAREMIAIVQGQSKALEKKEGIHKLAMVNRGNAQARI